MLSSYEVELFCYLTVILVVLDSFGVDVNKSGTPSSKPVQTSDLASCDDLTSPLSKRGVQSYTQ